MITSVTRMNPITIIATDSPSCIDLEILKIDIGINPSLSTIKSALQLMEAYINSEVRIPRPCSMYDCTGESFTTSIERIHRSIYKGYNRKGTGEEFILVGTYHHHISVDV